MSYKELFSAIECNRIVIIEDDFKQGEYKKERALYDITRMAVDDRCRYLAEIESISQPLHEVLSKFLYLTNALIKLECGMIAFPTGTLVVRLGWLKA